MGTPYNIKTATSSEICLTESSTGTFCTQWNKEETTTYNYFDTFYLFGKIISALIIIAVIVNMKKRK